ncbi:hypothetical protein N7468_008278 [Penicillium chermesinum]|uniref:Uncharacterized protein n=1 Tax=Penicillium chermesinum TaxID=63820 RepID=A0A9W9NPS4_9EURO|nr:uncharacterized protein N7468_008278 [Penicillium chermesinum]KAJ5223736.1 hypothetical protein N7468_008278 [Penicillium chermesinum]KAJ6155436.1 hypothetical protein N7470_006002 [Penicillium chermesinum]
MPDAKYPQPMLDRVAAAVHSPPADELPCQYKFVALYNSFNSIHDTPEERKIIGNYDTLAEANAAALEFFKKQCSDFFGQVDRQDKFYETGTPEDELIHNNGVEWGIDSRGLLTLTAHGGDGEEECVAVHDIQQDE